MLDKDVANLYHYKTKTLNLAVKRNIERFPDEFCFQLSESELNSLRFHFETSKENAQKTHNSRGGSRYLPYAFTEQGIAMLAGILKSDVAVSVSIKIIKAFISMRNFLSNNGQIFSRLTSLEYKQLENEKKFNKVFNMLNSKETIAEKIFFEGQIFDAYNLIIKLIKKAEKKITIIDNRELYHCGASIKDLGKKCFAITKMEETNFIEKLG